MKDFVSHMGLFNTAIALLTAIVPAGLKLTKSSPEIVIGSFLILLTVFFIGLFVTARQELKDKEKEIFILKQSHDIEIEKLKSTSMKEIDDLKKINDYLTLHKEDSIKNISKYKKYVHERSAFVEIHLIEIKEHFDYIFDEIQKWQTAMRNNMSDKDKDDFISDSKRRISKIIGDERRKNYDDRKDL